MSLKGLLGAETPEMQLLKMKGLKVAIIGGGWVGCHLASVMAKHELEITLFESEGQINMTSRGSSSWWPKLTEGNYTYTRLDSGALHPSNPEIREKCFKGSQEFMKNYGSLAKEIDCLY